MPFPPARREELLADLTEHITVSLAEAGDESDETVRRVPDGLGSPRAIVESAAAPIRACGPDALPHRGPSASHCCGARNGGSSVTASWAPSSLSRPHLSGPAWRCSAARCPSAWAPRRPRAPRARPVRSRAGQRAPVPGGPPPQRRPDDAERLAAGPPAHSRGSTGSDSSASTAKTASWTRHSGSPAASLSTASSPSAYSRSASERLCPRWRERSRVRCSGAV